MQLPPMPDFRVVVPDILGEQMKQATLADMLNRTLNQQKLFPLQMQEAQQKVDAATLENQIKREDLTNQVAFGKMFLAANGDVSKLTEMISDPKQNFGMTPRGIQPALQQVIAAKEGILKLQDDEAANWAKKNDVVLPLLQELKDVKPNERPLILVASFFSPGEDGKSRGGRGTVFAEQLGPATHRAPKEDAASSRPADERGV